MENEIWKIVPSVPGYEASSWGRIRCRKWVNESNGRSYGGKAWTGSWTGKRFICRFRGKTYKVARLVCEAFHGPPPKGKPMCLHINEQSANNRPENLRWGSQVENLNAAGFKARQTFKKQKLTDHQVKEIRLRSGERPCDLAREYGVAPCTIANIIARRMRTHV